MRTPYSDIPLAACRLGNPRSGGGVTKNSRRRESIWDAEPKRSGDRHARSRVPAGRQSRQNRLIEVAAITRDASGAITGVTNLVSCQYGRLARLVARTTTAATNYLHDGWNHIVEYSIQNSKFTIQNFHLWGMNLSATLQGAGGVGGMLATRNTDGNVYYPTYDGNGNVSEYLDSDGDPAAHMEYDSFGNLLPTSTGAFADFPHRFSTKYTDTETGLLYYGYRWYDPLTGRWPSRDLIEEEGGVNLYGFVGNDGIGRWDVIGRCPGDCCSLNGKCTPCDNFRKDGLVCNCLELKIQKEKVDTHFPWIWKPYTYTYTDIPNGGTHPLTQRYDLIARVLWKETPECECVKKCMKERQIKLTMDWRRAGDTVWKPRDFLQNQAFIWISNPQQTNGVSQWYLPTHQAIDLKVKLEVDAKVCKEHDVSVK